VKSELPVISKVIHRVVASLRNGGRLIYIGAGTSGRLAVLDASECPPTFGTDPSVVQGIIAGGTAALTGSVEGVEDDRDEGAREIAQRDVNEKDTVIGVSASGRTPYVIGALAAAATHGAFTVALVNNRPTPLEKVAQITIAPIVGPEIIAGSTRLKAGSSHKMVLNMISTVSMIELGKTYGNRMVDVQATNSKLTARAVRIIQQITGCNSSVAVQALIEASGSAKTAIVMVIHPDITVDQARAMLERSGGYLRKALSAEKK
jgi:N-acetylmuramic acid 6-phosphate etherase